MPELPEVETTRQGIAPHILGRRVNRVIVRQPRLRWPVPADLANRLEGQIIEQVERRAKYLLLRTVQGTLLLHLGMSGSLRMVSADRTPGKHDHIDIGFEEGVVLCLTDPRRFGAALWCDGPPESHPLIASLGPEPLSEAFTGDWLYERSRGRRLAVKNFIMDSHQVAGVGNIYANEALFQAGIDPQRSAGRISKLRYQTLCEVIKAVLTRAIEQGGTTLRDFVGSDGKPGYFKQELKVYGRSGLPCLACGSTLKELRLGQRSSVYCPHCQH
jgi:formamidopyrimidine-DNA glycosylase